MFTNSVHSRDAHPDPNSREDFALAAIVARDNRDGTPDSRQLTSIPTFASMRSPEHLSRTSCLLGLGNPNSLQGTFALLNETLNTIGTKSGESQSQVSHAEQRPRTSGFVSVNKPVALPWKSRLHKVDDYESSFEDANDHGDDSEDDEVTDDEDTNDDITDVGGCCTRKIHVKDPKEIERVAAAWWTMSKQDRSKYKLTPELRDAIWLPRGRAPSSEIAAARWSLDCADRVLNYPYAFDSFGHPYAQYRLACNEHPDASKPGKSPEFSMHAQRHLRCAVYGTIEGDHTSTGTVSAERDPAAESTCDGSAMASNNQMAGPNEASSRERAEPVTVKEELGDDYTQS